LDFPINLDKMINVSKIKSILKDIVRNYLVVLIMGFVGVIVICANKEEFEDIMEWYYISLLLCSAGGISCMIYGLIQYFKE